MYCDLYSAQVTACAIGEWVEAFQAIAAAVGLGLLLGVVLGITRFIHR